MTNLIAEGFGSYGIYDGTTPANTAPATTVTAAMLSGAWAEMYCGPVGINFTASGFQVQQLSWLPQEIGTWLYGGVGYSGATWNSPGGKARRVLPAAMQKFMTCFRFAVPIMPADSNDEIVVFCQADMKRTARLNLLPSGALQLFVYDVNGANPVAALTTDGPVIVAERATYLEIEYDATTGNFNLRADTVAVMTGTVALPNVSVAQLVFLTGTVTPSFLTAMAMTDLVIRSYTGSYNNALVGDRRVATLFVNSDDPAHQGWTAQPLHRFGTGVLQTADTPRPAVVCGSTTQTNLGNGDFTIEGNFRFNTLPTAANKAVLFNKWDETGNQRSYQFYKGGPSLEAGMLVFRTSTDGGAGTVQETITWPWEPDTGVWYHIAVVRASGILMLFINGIQQGVGIADTRTYFAGSAYTALAGQITGSVTSNTGAVSGTSLDGWVDEFRLSVGVARYTANFAPPTAAFPRGGSDANWSSVQWLSGFDSGINDESAAGRALTATSSDPNIKPAAVTPNDGSFNYQVINKRGVPLDYTFLEAALVNATGTLTQSALPTATATVTVGTKDGTNAAVYKWVTALASAYDVLIGADISASMDNLIAAVNGEAGAGTIYGTGTQANFDVSATKLPSLQMLVTANLAGTGGNSIASTTTDANGAWTGATLAGGANIPAYSQFGLTRPPNKTTIVDSATLVTRAWKTDAGPSTLKQSFVGPGGAVFDGANHYLGTAPSLYFDTTEVDPDTSAPLTPTTLVSGKVRLNRTS